MTLGIKFIHKLFLSLGENGDKMKKKLLVILAASGALVITLSSVGIAQEGSFTSFVSSVSRTFENIVAPNPQEQNAQDEEVSEADESEESAQETSPPVTYDNGFTEGDVIESSGVPTYSSKEFVPDGPDAPKEGEINPCVKEASIEQCELDIFNESWQREKPEGSNWEEVHFDDVFLGYPVPPMWENSETGETYIPNQTRLYLTENIHKHATGLIPNAASGVFISSEYDFPVIRFSPIFSVKGTQAENWANEAMFPMELSAVFTSQVSGRDIVLEQEFPTIQYSAESFGATSSLITGLQTLTPCDEGEISISVKTLYDGVTHQIGPIDYAVPALGELRCDKPSLKSAAISFGWVFAQGADSEMYIESFYSNPGYAFLYGVKPEGLENSFINFSSGKQSFRVSNPEVVDSRGESGGVRLDFPEMTTSNKDIPPGDYRVTLWLANEEAPIEVWEIGSANVGMDNNSGSVRFGEDF